MTLEAVDRRPGKGIIRVHAGTYRPEKPGQAFVRNGVDDRGADSSYHDTIFWRNDRDGGACAAGRYELVIHSAKGVIRCLIGGCEVDDLLHNVSRSANTFGAPDPDFDDSFRPRHRDYRGVGYRPPLQLRPSKSSS